MEDYISLIESLKDKLSIDQQELDSLDGYKKDWARYVIVLKLKQQLIKEYMRQLIF